MDTSKQENSTVGSSDAKLVINKRRKMPPHRKRNLILVTLVFIVIVIVFLLMYLLVWRYEEGTDDAYVAGNLVQITPQIPGTVSRVKVEDTDTVKVGDVLVQLDGSDFQLAYDKARNDLIQAIRQNKQQTAAQTQARAQLLAREADLTRAQSDLSRRESLAGTDAISGEELSHARAAVAQAKAGVSAAKAAELAAQAAIGSNVPLKEQPAVQNAISQMKNAWLNLQRTQIRSPIAGQVAKRNIQLGQQVAPGMPMMAVIPLQNLWVDANFKEVQLRELRIGQSVEMTSDLYGSKVVYHGKIVGLSAGTGNAFSLLPAQNATGNWIKVVQRVPVRISINEEDLKKYPLRVGLSMSVSVNTGNHNGQAVTAAVQSKTNPPQTEAVDWNEVDTSINQILEEYSAAK